MFLRAQKGLSSWSQISVAVITNDYTRLTYLANHIM